MNKGGLLLDIDTFFWDLPDVETKRLRLRKLTLEDAEDVFHYGSNEEVARSVTWYPYKTVDDAEEFIRQVLAFYEAGRPAPWAMELNSSGQVIGTVGFGNVKERHSSAEIAYACSHDFWGKGYTTEAVQEVIRIGFEELDLIRIFAKCLPENVASERVMQKVGMMYEGTERKSAYIKGRNRDLKVYAILHEDYFL